MHAAVQLLGRALKKLPRQEVFVTTKVTLTLQSPHWLSPAQQTGHA